MSEALVMTVESVRTRASTSEALVTFSVPLEKAGAVSSFMNRIGRQVGAAFADVDGVTPAPVKSKPKTKTPFGDYAKALRQAGFCRCPDVWRAAGTDAEFRAWIQRQPSWVSGNFSEYVEGEGRCVAAHVRRVADGAGTGHKPEYACVPLTDAEHQHQHQQGESALAPEADWDKARIEYVEQWCWDTVKTALGEDSMATVEPARLLAWAKERGVDRYLPPCYRETP
ncbi:MAG TPA: hypothetical protein VNE18_10330 [Rhodanobacter sp.]|nr:hypothetical protein [Rhodanobacter sp.]